MYTLEEQKYIEAFCCELCGFIFPKELEMVEKTAVDELQKFFSEYKMGVAKR